MGVIPPDQWTKDQYWAWGHKYCFSELCCSTGPRGWQASHPSEQHPSSPRGSRPISGETHSDGFSSGLPRRQSHRSLGAGALLCGSSGAARLTDFRASSASNVAGPMLPVFQASVGSCGPPRVSLDLISLSLYSIDHFKSFIIPPPLPSRPYTSVSSQCLFAGTLSPRASIKRGGIWEVLGSQGWSTHVRS